MNSRLGMSLKTEEVEAIMKRLRFPYKKDGGRLIVTAPSRRADIRIEEDLFEEVARLYGYDNIPTTFPEGMTTRGVLTAYQEKRRLVHRYFEQAGLSQVITYSLTSPEQAKGFAAEKKERIARSD